MTTHPLTEFANEYFSPKSVLYNPELFNAFSENLTLPLTEALKIAVIKTKYEEYKDEVFRDSINRSETVELIDDYIELKVPEKECVIMLFRLPITSNVKTEEMLEGHNIFKIEHTALSEMIYLEEDSCDVEAIAKIVKDHEVKNFQRVEETLRDCYLRYAYMNGVSKEEFENKRNEFEELELKHVVGDKPNGVYEKDVDEFMNESGYEVSVKPVDLRTYMKKVYEGEIKVNPVIMNDCSCVNHGDLPTRLLSNERPKPKTVQIEEKKDSE